MSTARDNGLAALQNADYLAAIPLLEAAIQEDPNDFQAHLYLGGAYGHAGRQMDAINILTAAVRLDPANAQARYNLGIAMDEGGYRDQAITVLQQALQLQPDYPRAQEALDRIQHNPAHGNDGFGAPMSAGNSRSYQPDMEQTQSTGDSTPAAQPTAYGQPPAQPTAYGQPPAQPTAYGQQPTQPTAYGQQPTQGYSAPTQAQPTYTPPGATTQMPASSMPPGQAQTLYGQQAGQSEPGLGSYSAPPAAKPFGQSTYPPPGGSYTPPGMNPYPTLSSYDDGFQIGRAFKEWGQALFSPVKLFSEMVGCTTNASSMALMLVYLLLFGLTCLVMFFIKGPIVLIQAIYLVIMPITWVIFALIVHMFTRAFGSTLSYGGSLRAVVYAAAPFVVVTMLNTILSQPPPGMNAITSTPSYTQGALIQTQYQQDSHAFAPKAQPAQYETRTPNGGPGQYSSPFSSTSATAQNPMTYLLSNLVIFCLGLFGVIWSIILLGVGVTNIHQISGGAAAGVAILSVIVSLVLMIAIGFLLAMVIGVAAFGAAGSMAH